MLRASTPSFVVTLPLVVPQDAERLLLDRLRAGGRLHNAVLQDGLAIVHRMRSDPRWTQARALPKSSRERTQLFVQLRKDHAFDDASFQRAAIAHKNAAGFAGRIGAHETQNLASRAFTALERWVYGQGGRPRFKSARRPLHSLEGKNNTGMLQWRAQSCTLQVERGLQLGTRMPDLRRDEWLASALQHEAKYCRLLWRNVGARRAWYVQVVLEGQAPVKASVLERLAPEGSVGGLDLGVSTVAWATPEIAGVDPLAPSASLDFAELRRLQRRLDRQRRANNPENYDEAGRAKRGQRTWMVSQGMRATQAQIASLQARLARRRRNEHGQLTNHLLSLARTWKDDGVSPRALQKMYGRAVAQRAPSEMMQLLARKAERAGGQRRIVNVRALKSSQYDHSTDGFVKKRLSERWHVFADGRGRVQRDVYSAFLHLHSEGDTNHPGRLETAWAHVEASLLEAGWFVPKTRSEGLALSREPSSRARGSVSSRSPAHHGLNSPASQAA